MIITELEADTLQVEYFNFSYNVNYSEVPGDARVGPEGQGGMLPTPMLPTEEMDDVRDTTSVNTPVGQGVDFGLENRGVDGNNGAIRAQLTSPITHTDQCPTSGAQPASLQNERGIDEQPVTYRGWKILKVSSFTH